MPSIPPRAIVEAVDTKVPGIYSWFVYNVESAVGDAPATLTSWYRNPQQNAEVGGHPESQHLVGLAADLVVARGGPWSPEEVAARLRFLGLTVSAQPTHLHVQALPPGGLRRLGLVT